MEPTMNPRNLQESADSLWNYLQSLDAEVVARLSRPASPEMAIVMERHIGNLLGYLPPRRGLRFPLPRIGSTLGVSWLRQ